MTSICEKKKLQPPEVFCKNGVLKNLAIISGKHLCWSLFAGLQVCNFIETPTLMFSCEYWEFFKNTYFEEHLRTAAYFMKKNRTAED